MSLVDGQLPTALALRHCHRLHVTIWRYRALIVSDRQRKTFRVAIRASCKFNSTLGLVENVSALMVGTFLDHAGQVRDRKWFCLLRETHVLALWHREIGRGNDL